MEMSISNDFRIKLPSGRVFSSQNEGAFFIESESVSKHAEAVAPLRMGNHASLILDILNITKSSGFWIVEAATPEAVNMLSSVMPNVIYSGTTIAGRFEPSLDVINSFWKTHSKLDSMEPWNYELPWAIFCVDEQFSPHHSKDAIILGTVLQDWNNLHGVFAQIGWHAFLGIKKQQDSVQRVRREFPLLFQDRA